MAGLGCSLHISELPSDVQHDRLIDKLLIHFLRPSNGGGEVVSITVSKGRPRSALITFEDRKVAQSVLGHCPHTLELDGQRHELSVTPASPSPVNPDKVILAMSATVNCQQLPLGKKAVTGLQHQFPDLYISFPSQEEHCCTFSGTYSQVQLAVAQLLELHESSRNQTPRLKPKEENGLLPAASVQMCSESEAPPSQNSLGSLGSSLGQEVEVLGAEGGVLALPQPGSPPLSAGEEAPSDDAEVGDLSLIMDSDQFQYLRRCDEYQRILREHGVEVVEETSQGLTTLFLQVGSRVTREFNGGESAFMDRAPKRLVQAHKELRQIQLQQEGCLRKDQLSKSSLYPLGGLRTAIESVQNLLPKLLLTQDDENVYIVGERSDVSQAKQLLLLGYQRGLGVVSPSLPSASLAPGHSLLPATSPSTEDTEEEEAEPQPAVEDLRLGKMLRTSGAERKQEYKLAARFKSSGVGSLGYKLTEMSDTKDLRDVDASKLIGKSRTLSAKGTTLVGKEPKVSSGGPGFDLGPLSPGLPEHTVGRHALFGDTDPRAFATMPKSTSLSTAQSSQAPLGPKMQVPPGAPSVSGAALRRANSFSGRSRSRREEERQEVPGTASGAIPRTRPRSNSVTGGLYSAEVIVPQVMWSHMKEAYGTRLDDMMSDLKSSEVQSETNSCIKVVLEGADSTVVATCQRELQKLVVMVKSDFTITKLPLSDLGITVGNDLFEACCTDVRARYRKVSQRLVDDSLYLTGPKLLCEQVNAVLREVFSPSGGGRTAAGAPQSSLKRVEPSADVSAHETQRGPGSSSCSADKNTNLKKDPQQRERAPSPPDKVTQHKKTVHADNRMPGPHQPALKPTPGVTKERLERSSATSSKRSRTYASPGNSPEAGQGAAGQGLEQNPFSSLPVTQLRHQDQGKQADLHLNHAASGSKCICGKMYPELMRMACGLSLCFQCEAQHDHCRICYKKETLSEQNHVQQQAVKVHASTQSVPGLHGSISFVELPLSLPGYPRDTTIKITYLIPDGVQDEAHPSPGSPFKGGMFVAFLPNNLKGRSFLPHLERALHMGLTFTISAGNSLAGEKGRVVWHKIPHKIKMDGGKSGNGYPDSSYLGRLSEALKAHGIEDPSLALHQNKLQP